MASVQPASSKSFDQKNPSVFPVHHQRGEDEGQQSSSKGNVKQTDMLNLSKMSQEMNLLLEKEMEKSLDRHPGIKKLYLAKGKSLASRNQHFLEDPFIKSQLGSEDELSSFYKEVKNIESQRMEQIKHMREQMQAQEPQVSYASSLKKLP